MKKYILTSVALLSLGFVNTIYAEGSGKGPTAQQTIDFLESKSCVKKMKIMDGKFMALEQTYDSEEHNTHIHYFSTALLSDLSPKIAIKQNSIEVVCSSNKCFDTMETFSKAPKFKHSIKGLTKKKLLLIFNSAKSFDSIKETIRSSWLNNPFANGPSPFLHHNSPPNGSRALSHKFYDFCNETNAKKAAKAFSHLIKLYGGKEELF